MRGDLERRLDRLEREAAGPDGGFTVLLLYVSAPGLETYGDGEGAAATLYEFPAGAPLHRSVGIGEEPRCRVTKLSAEELATYLATHEVKPTAGLPSALRDLDV